MPRPPPVPRPTGMAPSARGVGRMPMRPNLHIVAPGTTHTPSPGSILDRIAPQPMTAAANPASAPSAPSTATAAAAAAAPHRAASGQTADPLPGPQALDAQPSALSVTVSEPGLWLVPAQPRASERTSLSDLPLEMLHEVLKRLPGRSLAAASSACRAWHTACNEQWLWLRQLCWAAYAPPCAAAAAQLLAAAAAAAQRRARDPHQAAVQAVAGVRGVRAVRAVHAAGGGSHEDFLGGLAPGFLDRLQAQAEEQQQQQPPRRRPVPPPGPNPYAAAEPPALPPQRPVEKAHFGQMCRLESNWRNGRYAESALREHSSNVECLALVDTEPWGKALVSAAWDGAVRVWALGPAHGAPQQARCVRRYHGHTGWVTSMAAGRHQVITASTDRRIALWCYACEGPMPLVMIEHPQEVTTVRFCYTPPPPPTKQAAPAPAPSYAQPCTAPLVGPQAALPYDASWEDYVISGSIDGVVRMWHVPSGQLLRVFVGHADVVWSVACLQGSSVMVTTSRDGFARLWQLPAYGAASAAVAALAAQQAQVAGQAAGAAAGAMPAAAAMGGAHGVAAAGLPLEAGEGGVMMGGHGAGLPVAAVPPVATLQGHHSAVLCTDVCLAPVGAVAAHLRQQAAKQQQQQAAGPQSSGTLPAQLQPATQQAVLRDGGLAVAGIATAEQRLAYLRQLLKTHLITGLMHGTQAVDVGSNSSRSANTSGAHSAHGEEDDGVPTWLVATGGADALIQVWDLSRARSVSTLAGHRHGVLSCKFGMLPRTSPAAREAALLPGDIGPPAAGGAAGSERLVLVSGSVREVRIWDPIAGICLQELQDHAGPVTTISIVHGMLVTLAMNDSLIVYACHGVDGDPWVGQADGSPGSPGGSAGRLRQAVAAHKRAVEPVICLQDAVHHSFAAALAADVEGLVVGSATGDISYLDFRPRVSALPVPTRQQHRQAPGGRSPFVIRF